MLAGLALGSLLVVVFGTAVSGANPVAQSGVATTLAPEAPDPAIASSDDADDPAGELIATVAGFGLIAVWLSGAGVALVRAKRRQRAKVGFGR